MTGAVSAATNEQRGFLQAGAGGVLTGAATPLLQPAIDMLEGSPGDIRIALLALPFAILVLVLVRVYSTNAWWAALVAALITIVAFVCAVNAAIWIDGQASGAGKTIRNVLAGLAGGLTGSAIMALGICLLPAGPRDLPVWLPMIAIGAIAGSLLAVDNALGLDLFSVLYPVWQAGVAVGLAMALHRASLH